MSAKRDPFELLPLLVEPEPDQALMDATIAQSREAFARSHALGAKPRSRLSWLKTAPAWLMPAAAGAAALVIAVAIAPGLISTMPTNQAIPHVADRPEPMPSPTLSRGNDQVAEAPTQAASPPRMGMGMQPGPSQRLDEAPALVSTFKGSGVIIGSRLSHSMLELTLPDLTGDQVIDSQMLLDDEEIEILAAFRSAEDDFVAVQLRVNDERFWRIYTPVSGSYQRDVERSELVSNAQDQAEVTRRLTGG